MENPMSEAELRSLFNAFCEEMRGLSSTEVMCMLQPKCCEHDNLREKVLRNVAAEVGVEMERIPRGPDLFSDANIREALGQVPLPTA